MMNANDWITKNYTNMYTWARRINKKWRDDDDLVHYTITSFLSNTKADKLASTDSIAKFFCLKIMMNSQSRTSEFSRKYRLRTTDNVPYVEPEEYNSDEDVLISDIEIIIQEMYVSSQITWYMASIFQLCISQKHLNFSELSRKIGIPRTSLSNTYYETVKYIKERL